MPYPIVTTVTLTAAASATAIALAQSVGVPGGPLILNGTAVTAGVAVLDNPRRVVIHSNGDNRAITFAVTGTGGAWLGAAPFTEIVTGTNASDAVTARNFLTVTSIVASAATTGTVTAGTNNVGSGPWVVWDAYTPTFNVSLYGTVLSGAPTWSVEYTYDDPFGLWLPANIQSPRPLPFALMSGQTGSADGNFNSRVVASRLTLTALGSVMLTQQQQGTR
jgi:hypothetical protein